MENLERLQAAYKDNSKQMSEIITRYHKRMQDKEIAFNAIFAKIWELEPRAEGAQNPFASTKDITEQAIKAVGYNLNDEIAKAFLQHEADYYEFAKLDAKGLELGFKIAAFTIEENAHKEETTPTQGNEWLFVPISIVAPQQIQDEIITPLLQANAQKGEGLFANNTEIPLEDENEDDFLMVEAYDCKASLCGYWQELKDNGIIGIGKTNAFFSYQFRQYLLQLLKEVATFIKDNTNKPSKAKNKVTTTLKGLDKIPVWGLFFQILLLQGLCRWLESVDINEGAKGYKEAQLMYNWLCLTLADKEFNFCKTPYGDKDKQMLQPLCNYLYSTEIGKEVQKCIREYLFGKPQQENPNVTTNHLPSELDTEDAHKYLTKAKEIGLIDDNYKWQKGKQLLACFCHDMSQRLSLGKGERIAWKPFEALFGIEKGKLRSNYNDIQKTGQNPSDIALVDEALK